MVLRFFPHFLNETAVVTEKSERRPELREEVRHRHLLCCLDFTGIGASAIHVDNVAEVVEFVLRKFTLAQAYALATFGNALKQNVEVLRVLLCRASNNRLYWKRLRRMLVVNSSLDCGSSRIWRYTSAK